MAKLGRVAKTAVASGKITKRDLLLQELSELLEEHFDEEVKFTKEGIVVAFKNEKGLEKDFVFRIVEKKERIVEGDFLE